MLIDVQHAEKTFQVPCLQVGKEKLKKYRVHVCLVSNLDWDRLEEALLSVFSSFLHTPRLD